MRADERGANPDRPRRAQQLARRAGADLPLLQRTLRRASITVTAHIYADLYDDVLDDASALDVLDDSPRGLP
jgi:hypothetical protein